MASLPIFMNESYFKHRYRIPSNRKSDYDYSQPGRYFVTICTKGKIPWFGELRNGFMGLNSLGCIVEDELMKTSIIRSNAYVGTHIVMPDHVHVIIHIIQPAEKPSVETPWHGVSTNSDNCVKWKSGVLGSIVQQFKSACTKRIRSMGHINFAWQSRYYDHIIRSDDECEKIGEYIRFNPIRHSLRMVGDV